MPLFPPRSGAARPCSWKFWRSAIRSGSAALREAAETQHGGSIALGLALHRLEKLAIWPLRPTVHRHELHRKGFRLLWTWKVRQGRPGRPVVPREICELIRTISRENPLWGAPRIHGELLKLGIDVGETSVSKYMTHRRRPPSQTWRTFLDKHVKSLVSVDFFTVPTIRFQILYVFLVLVHERRRILHCVVTAHPTAEWTAHQLREASPWDTAPRSLLRDRIFGQNFVDQVKAM